MTVQPRDFDQVAAQWDEQPRRRRLAAAVAAGIAATIPLHRGMRALEYGCGTGLVGLQLAGRLGHLTAADASQGMLQELGKKCRALGLKNVNPLLVPLEQPCLPDRAYELVFTSMLLHHVPAAEGLLRQFCAALTPGGYLALADLELEDGSFHDHPRGVAHHGFNREALAASLSRLGLADLRDQTVFTIIKQRGAREDAYPVFLLTGKNP